MYSSKPSLAIFVTNGPPILYRSSDYCTHTQYTRTHGSVVGNCIELGPGFVFGVAILIG